MKFEQFCFAFLFVPLIADDYILGGYEVTTEEYPFIARLAITLNNMRYMRCTGSLVADDLILTASHCFSYEDGWFPNGTATFNDADEKVIEGREITYHMRFVHNYTNSDLALAKLEKKVTDIKPVKISKKHVEPGDSVKAVGFGWHDLGKRDGHLRHIDLKVSSVEGNYIYTKVGENNEGPCAGDSGGPLLVKDGGNWSVVAALYGNGFDCRDGGVNGDDKWSSVRVMGSDDLDRWG